MTKLNYVLECVTPAQAKPFLERMAERRMVDVGLLSFFGVKLPWLEVNEQKKALPMRQEDVTIGGYCKGSCVRECQALFGVALWQACRTCPT